MGEISQHDDSNQGGQGAEQIQDSSLQGYHRSLVPNLERLKERKRQNEAIEQAMGERSLAKYHHSLEPNLERLEERRRQRDAIDDAMHSRGRVDTGDSR